MNPVDDCLSHAPSRIRGPNRQSRSRDPGLIDLISENPQEVGEFFTEISMCLPSDPEPDPMAAEYAFRAVLSKGHITVEITGSDMTWRAGRTALFFKQGKP